MLFQGWPKGLAIAAAGLLCAAGALAEQRTVLILHTNDIHDHVRPGYGGRGGLPYIGGYVRAVREKRDDVLLLDAGDVREKGDWVAHLTGGELIFRAMGEIGYDAVVPGNHDVRDLEQLDKCEEWLGQPFVAANIADPKTGAPRYNASRVFEVNGVRVGVIGITRRDKGPWIPKMDFSKRVFAEEAERLKDEVDLLIGLMHEGAMDAVRLSQAAPDVDVIVAGHTHQGIRTPIVVQDTGALMVQAGSNAHYVGRLELTIDLERGEIVDYHGEIVPMDHDAVAPDPGILAMVAEAEAEHCPEAAHVIARSKRMVGMGEAAQLVAETLRAALDADIGLAMADKVIRNNMPEGDIDLNAVFRALAPWALETMTIELSGEKLLAYLGEHYGTWERPHWSGARIVFERGPDREVRVAETDLDPDRVYTVALTTSEWERLLEGFLSEPAAAAPRIREGVATDRALRAFVEALDMDAAPLCERAAAYVEAAAS